MAPPLAVTRLRLGSSPAAPARPDDWPHTTRLLPWLLALFMAMVFLVPFDSAKLPVSLPFDAKLDRVAVVALALLWIPAVIGGGPGAPRLRRSPVNLALGIFAAIAVASVLLNLEPLAIAGELNLVLKKLVLLAATIAFFIIVASSVRPGEVRPFAMLLVGLAIVTAAGTIYEYRSGTNLFFNLAKSVLGTVVEPRASSSLYDATGRRPITGPTAHGLALTTMLSLVLPLAVLGVMRARELSSKLLYAAITAIILSGSIATVRKTAAIVPLVGFIVLALYRPRAMVRLAPLLAVLVVVIHLMAPGAMGSIKSQLFPQGGFYNQASVQGRTEDYAAISPDLKHHPIIGRGYGSYDPDKYRLLDNQYLGLRVETGYLGYVAYLLLLLAVALPAHRLVRTRDPSLSAPALATIAAAAVVAVASELFDAISFPQVPYVLLFLAGLVTAGSHALHGRTAGDASGPPQGAATRAASVPSQPVGSASMSR